MEIINRTDLKLEVNMFPNLHGREFEDSLPLQRAVGPELRSGKEKAIVKTTKMQLKSELNLL